MKQVENKKKNSNAIDNDHLLNDSEPNSDKKSK